MNDEEKTALSFRARAVQFFNAALWSLLSPGLSLTLLGIAIVESLLAPLFGMKLALCGLATAAGAIGLIFGMLLCRIELVVGWAPKIYEGIVSLHDEEIRKLLKSRESAAPQERPRTGWKM